MVNIERMIDGDLWNEEDSKEAMKVVQQWDNETAYKRAWTKPFAVKDNGSDFWEFCIFAELSMDQSMQDAERVIDLRFLLATNV